MIHYLSGKLAIKLDMQVVIEVGGIGYQVFMAGNSSIFLSPVGEEVKVYTYMQVREDDLTLYGFMDERSMSLFKKLITVNSVGAKAAMWLLSAMPIDEVERAIVFEDLDTLTRANGIGKKTAQKIVLELKDKVDLLGRDGETPVNIDFEQPTGEREVAIEALINLGYSRSEATLALTGVKDENMTAEEYIKLALKKI